MDEKSCGLIAAPAFEVGKICQVDPLEIKASLEAIFTQWGKPESIKIDNGRPLADPTGQTIPALVLWLYSQNIKVILNRKRQPTDNAKVERMQGVTKSLAEPGLCENIEELNQKLKDACTFQRSYYPTRTLNKKTRIEVYPQLGQPSSRIFDKHYFDLDAVHQFLSVDRKSWSRKVSEVGQISFMGQLWQTGQKYAGENILIQFNSQTNHWMFFTTQMVLIKEMENNFITKESIKELVISKRQKTKIMTIKT